MIGTQSRLNECWKVAVSILIRAAGGPDTVIILALTERDVAVFTTCFSYRRTCKHGTSILNNVCITMNIQFVVVCNFIIFELGFEMFSKSSQTNK